MFVPLPQAASLKPFSGRKIKSTQDKTDNMDFKVTLQGFEMWFLQDDF